MSVPEQDPINQVLITASQTTVNWLWNLQKQEDLVVFKQVLTTGLIETLILDTDYTVNTAGLDNDNGGTITLEAPQLPAVAGDIMTLFRVSGIDRSPDFATSGAFFALTINEQLDELTRIAQDVNRDVAGAVRKDPGVGDTLNPLIPQPVDERALKFRDTGGGNFEMVMSNFNPDATGDAQASADEAAASADEAAASAAQAKGLYSTTLQVIANTVLTVNEGGFLISVDTSSGDIDITLPDSSTLAGDFRVAVVKNSSDSNKVNVKVAGSDTVNGGTSDTVQRVENKIVDYVLDKSSAEYIASDVSSNVVQGTSVASATQPNIWAGDGNTIHMTGTNQVDDFTDAPRIGAKVTIIFDDVLILKDGLGITLQGGADITTAAGDRFEVYADAVDAFSGVYTRAAAPPAAFSTQLFHVQDQKATSTDGGTFTLGADRTRDLNTILANEIIGASLSSNQITLPAGTYYMEASAPAHRIGDHRAKLKDITGGVDLLTGTAETISPGAFSQTRSFISGRFTLSVASVLEVQHRAENTDADDGFGASTGFGPHEFYTDVRIWKVG